MPFAIMLYQKTKKGSVSRGVYAFCPICFQLVIVNKQRLTYPNIALDIEQL
jgi:hypothetical protein